MWGISAEDEDLDATSDDPWGEEPDWAVSDDDDNNSNENGGGDGDGSGKNHRSTQGGSRSARSSSNGTIVTLPGAQHILILLDCHHSMFRPYISTLCNTTRTSQENNHSNDDMDEGGEEKWLSPMDAALIAAKRLLQHRVHHVATTRTGKRDGVGIVLFNCPLTNTTSTTTTSTTSGNGNECIHTLGGYSSTGVRILIPLEPPGVDQILTIRSFMKQQHSNDNGNGITTPGSGENGKSLERELYGHLMSKPEPMGNHEDADPEMESEEQIISLRSALFQINKILTDAKCVKKSTSASIDIEDSKTVWIFTNQDDPTHGDEEQREVMQSVCKDLEENDVAVKLWALPKVTEGAESAGGMDGEKQKDELFDRGKFYDYITTLDEYDDDDGYTEERGRDESQHGNDLNLERLLDQFCISWEKTRKAQSIPMYLPDWNTNLTHLNVNGNVQPCDENGDVSMNHDGHGGEKEQTYPGIMLDIYQIIRIKKKPQPTTIHSITRK